MPTKRAFWCWLSVVLGLSGCVQAQQQAEWTVVFYMASDNDLEAPQMQDLEEMLQVGSTATVNLVALVDRCENDDPEGNYSGEAVGGIANWTDARLLQVDHGKLTQLANWGEVNTGDPATITRLLKTALQQFPAKRTAFVFGDHGMSWMGACCDESVEDHDQLTLAEIVRGLREGLGNRKLALVGFDCCLMASVEVAHAMAPLAEVMVASEELEPGDGWNYTPTLQALVDQPTMDAATLGRQIADQFYAFFAKSKDKETRQTATGVTLAVIDLAKIAAVTTAVKNLAAVTGGELRANGRTAWLPVAEARAQAEEYGKDGDPEEPGMAVHDLVHLASELQLAHGEGAVYDAAEAVLRAAKAAVVHTVKGRGRPQANGLSIYLPPDGETLQNAEPAPYSEVDFARASGWLPLVEQYVKLADGDEEDPGLAAVEVADGADDTLLLTSQVDADDLDEASFILGATADDVTLVLGVLPAAPDEDGKLEMEWDGGWFTIDDGEQTLICPITAMEAVEDEEDAYFAAVPVELKRRNKDTWVELTLFFYLDFSGDELVGELVYVYRDSERGEVEVELRAGDTLRPLYLAIDDEGNEELIASDDADDWLTIDDPDNLTVGYDALPGGKYLAGFLVTDLAGNTAEDLVEVELEE
ncbi:MAG: hypothetical protein IT204_20190 [Fimbriimonadaceae bacterium]|nr:hypothetical protein [Fimbriimonadaceae bacterium]